MSTTRNRPGKLERQGAPPPAPVPTKPGT